MTAVARVGVTVREARDDDDLDALNVGNPMWFGQEQHRRTASVARPGSVMALVGELDGTPVGWGFGIGAAVAVGGYGVASVWVPTDQRRRGLGGALLARVEEFVRGAGRPGVLVAVPDTEPDGLAVARHLGLDERGHHIESVLDLTVFDDSVVDVAVSRLATAGIELVTVAPDADEAAWQRVYTLFAARIKESPDTSDGGGEMPYAIFRSFLDEPWQVLLAECDGEPIGLTCMMVRHDAPHRLNTLFTGVRADKRGQGIAASLKLEHARRVRVAGWREIWTQNMDQNAAILAVNARLGYRPVDGYRDMGRAYLP